MTRTICRQGFQHQAPEAGKRCESNALETWEAMYSMHGVLKRLAPERCWRLDNLLHRIVSFLWLSACTDWHPFFQIARVPSFFSPIYIYMLNDRKRFQQFQKSCHWRGAGAQKSFYFNCCERPAAFSCAVTAKQCSWLDGMCAPREGKKKRFWGT